MGYMTAQGALKTLLLTITGTTGFGANDVSEGDLRILDSGSTNLAVLFPGSVPPYDTAGMVREHEHEAIVDLFTKFVDDTAYSTFGTLRDAVIDKLDTTKVLSSVYFVTSIVSDGDPVELYDKQGGGPFFITQRLRLTIVEEV